MNPWFNFKGKNSAGLGLWVSALPNIVVPMERAETVVIPGRAGALNLTEGEDVYDGYVKEIVVTCINEAVTPELLNWLRGEGDLIVSNDQRFVYQARVSGIVEFSRIGNCLSQATIPFWVQPFKKAENETQYQQTITGTTTIVNPGHIAAKPKLSMTGTGALVISCGGRSMIFTHRPVGGLLVDCDAEIMVATAQAHDQNAYYYPGDYVKVEENSTDELYRITTEGLGSVVEWEHIGPAPEEFKYLWMGDWSGEYLRIPQGSNSFAVTGTSTITIDPQWRWI